MEDEQTTDNIDETLDGNSLGTEEQQPIEEAAEFADEKDIDSVFNLSKSRYLFDTGLKRPLPAAPTYDPTNFFDQFAHYDDKLYVNIDNNWVTAGETTKSRCRVIRLSTGQTIPDDTDTELEWNAESLDSGGDFSSNGFILPRTGYYHVYLKVYFECVAVGDNVQLYIKVNGSTVASYSGRAGFAGNCDFQMQDMVIANAGAEITANIRQKCGSSRDTVAGPTYTYMTITEL